LKVVGELLDNVNRYYELQLCYVELASLGAKNIKFDLLKGKFTFECDTATYNKIGYRSAWLKSLNGEKTFIGKVVEECGKLIKKWPDNWFSHMAYPFKARMRPQTARSLINIVCPREGTILDPFCGSGTTNVEAYLLGLNSVGVDIVPFYVFMSEAKIKFFDEPLNMGLKARLAGVSSNHPLIEVLKACRLLSSPGMDFQERAVLLQNLQDLYFKKFKHMVKSSSHRFFVDTATSLPLESNLFDGIVTSPPYGSGIDYLSENPGPNELMKIPYELKPFLIFSGGSKRWYGLMYRALKEMVRVLKKHGRLAIIVGDVTEGGVRKPLADWCKSLLVKFGCKPLYDFTELISSTGTRHILTDRVIIVEKVVEK